jgi:DNA processing protein
VNAGSLDRGQTRRYQQRLAMLSPERHNPRSFVPTSAFVTGTIRRIDRAEAELPGALADLPDPPAELWYRGSLPPAASSSAVARTVAIVGSRGATRTGCALAADIAAAVARRGVAVVSGGALGIDAAAHRGALAAGGATFAVLGCGVDVVFPDRHGPLFAEIVERGGGLLSEFPPGTPPLAWHFPVRNRIVAALAEVVIVIDARARSGALITAGLARKLSRRLLAVPGSPGTDALIASGRAAPVAGASDVLRILAGAPAEPARVPSDLAPIVAALRAGAAGPAEVARRLGTSLAEALTRLTSAELSGWVRRLPGGKFEVPHAS